MPFVNRTRATLRRAEFGFLGVCVITRVQTPRFCGAPASAGVFTFALAVTRPLRTSWLTVGNEPPICPFSHNNGRPGRRPCQPDEAGYPNGEGPANAEPRLASAAGEPSQPFFRYLRRRGFPIYKS